MSRNIDESLTREQLLNEVWSLRARLAAFERAGIPFPAAIAGNMRNVETWLAADGALSMFLNQLPAVMWSVDSTLRFTLSIGAGLKGLGLEPGQLVGVSLYEYFNSTNPTIPAINAHIRVLKGESVNWQTHWQGRIFESHAEPLRNTAGDITGVIGIAIDITERQAAIQALRENEIRYRTLAETGAMGIWQIDAEGYTLYANPTLCAMLEVDDPKQLEHTTYHEFFTPESLLAVQRERNLRLQGIGSHYEVEMVGRRGGHRHVLLSGAPIMNAQGQMESMIGTFTDISARKQAERELHESNERFLTLAKVAPVGIIVCDENGLCSYANERWCHFCGLTPEQARGANWGQAIHPDDRERIGREWKQSLRDNVPFRCEFRLLAADGPERWMIGEATASHDEQGRVKYYVGAATDITELRAVQEALGHTENLAAAGRMSARIAHEINNPLAGIKNSFLLIKDAVDPQHPYFSYVGRIEKEIDRIARIVAQMLDMYRPDQATPREFRIGEAIQDVVSFLEPGAKDRGIQIITRLPEAQQSVLLPESSLRQILYNVLQNAIEASPPKGVVRVEASVDRQLLMHITDHGSGIPSQIAFRIFEPFFTTKHGAGNRGGLGLGLSTSHSLVEAMGGTITFDSSQAGTTFQISIPLTNFIKES